MIGRGMQLVVTLRHHKQEGLPTGSTREHPGHRSQNARHLQLPTFVETRIVKLALSFSWRLFLLNNFRCQGLLKLCKVLVPDYISREHDKLSE